jgi:hypothetical protein
MAILLHQFCAGNQRYETTTKEKRECETTQRTRGSRKLHGHNSPYCDTQCQTKQACSHTHHTRVATTTTTTTAATTRVFATQMLVRSYRQKRDCQNGFDSACRVPIRHHCARAVRWKPHCRYPLEQWQSSSSSSSSSSP